MNLNTKRSKVPHIHSITTYPRIPNFIAFHSTASCFRVTGHFGGLNDPKMTLNTKRSKIPHIHSETTPAFPDFAPFRSTASRFRITCHFETSVPNDPKMTFNAKRSKAPHICVTTRSESQILFRFPLPLDICKTFAISPLATMLNSIFFKIKFEFSNFL